jgi:hypothetical protein
MDRHIYGEIENLNVLQVEAIMSRYQYNAYTTPNHYSYSDVWAFEKFLHQNVQELERWKPRRLTWIIPN